MNLSFVILITTAVQSAEGCSRKYYNIAVKPIIKLHPPCMQQHHYNITYEIDKYLQYYSIFYII